MNKASGVRFILKGFQPPITKALLIGDLFRKSVFKALGKIYRYGDIPEKYSGKEEGTLYLAGSHEHAYYLPEPDFSDGDISFINLFMPWGFEPEELLALSGINRLWSSDLPDIKLEQCSSDPFQESPLFMSSKKWTSLTPYLFSRHPRIKRSERRTGSLFRQALERELHSSVLSNLEAIGVNRKVEIEIDWSMQVSFQNRSFRWNQFIRERLGTDHQAAVRYGHGFKLHFDKPVKGPISMGYASHMGLGMFMPE